ncbi:MAG: heat-inducible transcriptional repressor HrcA [Candidatus Dormibacteraeota bacterium]|jgi:heat-inducible transcriptional repressor|nr:heat-inducible transcriptional repressor HrcA [Candidatus Dormibacteraeota bacterium]
MEQRKQDILKAVINEFTSSALPVGSQALVSRYFVKLSPATVRSELSELADLGYLVQPHTSAGRIPTDRGYRYFVDFLMDLQLVPVEVDAFIGAEMRAAPADPQGLVEKVATTTAAVTHNAAVVSSPHGPQARLKHVDLVSLEPTEVLIILLVEGNLLRQQVLAVSEPVQQADLSRLANRINRELGGRDRDALGLRLRRLGPGLEKELLERLVEALELFERGTETLVVHDGVRNLLRQPEFAEASRLHQVLEVLEETRYLAALLQELVGSSDLQVVIGSENQTSQLRACTVVLTTYGPSRRLKGVLGVVGPTRMDYGQTVGRLQAVARHASERMSEAWA